MRVLLNERAKLLGYIWAIVRDEHLCEDVFQEISLLAIAKRDEIYDESSLLPWLRSAARHRALHVLKSRKRHAVLMSDRLLDTLDKCWQRYDDTPAATLSSALRQCAAQLTSYAKEIITLRYVRGLSGIQVAERLGCTPHALYTALTRIHGKLRACVQQEIAREEGRNV